MVWKDLKNGNFLQIEKWFARACHRGHLRSLLAPLCLFRAFVRLCGNSKRESTDRGPSWLAPRLIYLVFFPSQQTVGRAVGEHFCKSEKVGKNVLLQSRKTLVRKRQGPECVRPLRCGAPVPQRGLEVGARRYREKPGRDGSGANAGVGRVVRLACWSGEHEGAVPINGELESEYQRRTDAHACSRASTLAVLSRAAAHLTPNTRGTMEGGGGGWPGFFVSFVS